MIRINITTIEFNYVVVNSTIIIIIRNSNTYNMRTVRLLSCLNLGTDHLGAAVSILSGPCAMGLVRFTQVYTIFVFTRTGGVIIYIKDFTLIHFMFTVITGHLHDRRDRR